jgi:hypothetical protein
MKIRLIIFAAALFLLVEGCATNMFRSAGVITPRIEVENQTSNGLTPNLAADLFRDVANQLGFIVKGPVKLGQSSNYSIEYSADAPASESKNRTSLAMLIDGKRITFVGNIYGSKEDFVAAQNAAALFEQALDKHGIQYKTYAAKNLYQGGL